MILRDNQPSEQSGVKSRQVLLPCIITADNGI